MELFRFGFHVLRDQGLAEEMVQETFIKFCQQAPNYNADRGPVRGWLFTMARSAAYDIARRPSSRPFLPVEDFQLPPQYDPHRAHRRPGPRQAAFKSTAT
jgi:DNA-directed RNA polymerase specialized sigma24 family protein